MDPSSSRPTYCTAESERHVSPRNDRRVGRATHRTWGTPPRCAASQSRRRAGPASQLVLLSPPLAPRPDPAPTFFSTPPSALGEMSTKPCSRQKTLCSGSKNARVRLAGSKHSSPIRPLASTGRISAPRPPPTPLTARSACTDDARSPRAPGRSRRTRGSAGTRAHRPRHRPRSPSSRLNLLEIGTRGWVEFPGVGHTLFTSVNRPFYPIRFE
jgi:hypothetical protein